MEYNVKQIIDTNTKMVVNFLNHKPHRAHKGLLDAFGVLCVVRFLILLYLMYFLQRYSNAIR